jgi:hypothetical protein
VSWFLVEKLFLLESNTNSIQREREREIHYDWRFTESQNKFDDVGLLYCALGRNREHLPRSISSVLCSLRRKCIIPAVSNNPLLRIFPHIGLLVFSSSLWELNNCHVFVVAELCFPIAAVAQRWTSYSKSQYYIMSCHVMLCYI